MIINYKILRLKKKLIKAENTPFLGLHVSLSLYEVQLELHNNGPGLAIIRKITFLKGKKSNSIISSLLDIPVEAGINYEYRFDPKLYSYLKSGQSVTLLSIMLKSEDHQPLYHDGFQPHYNDLWKQIANLQTFIEYSDILNNQYEPFHDIFLKDYYPNIA